MRENIDVTKLSQLMEVGHAMDPSGQTRWPNSSVSLSFHWRYDGEFLSVRASYMALKIPLVR